MSSLPGNKQPFLPVVFSFYPPLFGFVYMYDNREGELIGNIQKVNKVISFVNANRFVGRDVPLLFLL
jgi:hypothetical protein